MTIQIPTVFFTAMVRRMPATQTTLLGMMLSYIAKRNAHRPPQGSPDDMFASASDWIQVTPDLLKYTDYRESTLKQAFRELAEQGWIERRRIARATFGHSFEYRPNSDRWQELAEARWRVATWAATVRGAGV